MNVWLTIHDGPDHTECPAHSCPSSVALLDYILSNAAHELGGCSPATLFFAQPSPDAPHVPFYFPDSADELEGMVVGWWEWASQIRHE